MMEYVEDALHGIELEPGETAEILGFANRELPHLHTPETSYFVLGSYRDPYIRRLRTVQNELDRRFGTYPFLMGDLRELDIDRIPTFRIRFALLAAYTDYIIAVYEQDAGGEITELGKISSTPYFEKSYVLPRDYDWMTDRELDDRESVLAAAVNVYFNDDLDSETVDEELESIAEAAQKNGLDVTKETILERIEEREDVKEEAVTYSWVHLNEFRVFELHDQCFPWTTPSDLRNVVTRLP